MTKSFASSLCLCATFAAITLVAATSNAAWPRYRVAVNGSLPSAPAYRPAIPVAPLQPAYQPVYPTTQAYYGPTTHYAPRTAVPTFAPVQPNFASPAPIVSNYQPYSYQAPNYAQTNYAAPSFVPSNTSYYAQPVPQMPLQLPPASQSFQTYGNYYQPNRPAGFNPTTPNYQAPVYSSQY